ncbi:hypothetical protein TNCV_1088141 [Trichonephila clavipes]|uniref:Uncharacterized protein n=1 Tax=Trichonephila clavipes TaxID=2585209 RepID=A0A8X6SST9_TRICX|nr:hypothetical protein TNCV_1088141 [Trichonephila clavipes]
MRSRIRMRAKKRILTRSWGRDSSTDHRPRDRGSGVPRCGAGLIAAGKLVSCGIPLSSTLRRACVARVKEGRAFVNFFCMLEEDPRVQINRKEQICCCCRK